MRSKEIKKKNSRKIRRVEGRGQWEFESKRTELSTTIRVKLGKRTGEFGCWESARITEQKEEIKAYSGFHFEDWNPKIRIGKGFLLSLFCPQFSREPNADRSIIEKEKKKKRKKEEEKKCEWKRKANSNWVEKSQT